MTSCHSDETTRERLVRRWREWASAMCGKVIMVDREDHPAMVPIEFMQAFFAGELAPVDEECAALEQLAVEYEARAKGCGSPVEAAWNGGAATALREAMEMLRKPEGRG